MNSPVLKDYVNRIINSEIRATILSIKGLTSRLLFVIIGPFAGWLSDFYGLQTAFLILGGIFFLLGSISLLFLHINRAL